MSSPEARGLTHEWIAEHGDPDLDAYIPVDPPHWREQEEALDRWLAEHPSPDYGAPTADRGDSEATTDFYVELARALEAADQDRADRADPDLAPLLDARDAQAAAGDFDLAETTQGVIDAARDRGEPERTDMSSPDPQTTWEIGALNEAQHGDPTWEPSESMDDELLQGQANALQAEQHDMERE